jgi:hypothetical protein
MNSGMKQLFIILFVLTTISGCKKHAATFSSSGTLTGPDYALCPCCGGVFLERDDKKIFHIESLPGMTQQELYNLNFPKNIRYNWKADRECGGISYIFIKAYKFD